MLEETNPNIDRILNTDVSRQRILVEYGLQDDWRTLHFFAAKADLPIKPIKEIADTGYAYKYVGDIKKNTACLIVLVDEETEGVKITTEDLTDGKFKFKYLEASCSPQEVFCARPRTIICESGDVYMDTTIDGHYIETMTNKFKDLHKQFLEYLESEHF